MQKYTKAKVYISKVVENDIGGYEKTVVEWGVIEGIFVPAKNQLVLGDGKINLQTVTEFYTKNNLPMYVEYIIHNDIRYKVIEQGDYIKFKLLTIERVE